MKKGILPDFQSENNHTTSQFFTEPKAADATFFPDNREEAITQRKMQQSIYNSPRMVSQRKTHAAIFGKPIQKMGNPEEEMMQGKFGKPIQKMGNPEEEMMQGKFGKPIQKMGNPEEEMMQGKFGKPIQKMGNPEEEMMQGKFGKPIQKMGNPEEEMMQGKFGKPIQKMGNPEEEMMQGKFGKPIQKMGNPEEEMMQGKFSQPIQKKGNSTGMPDGVKQKMEGAIGADFSDVKIHANSSSAPEVGALAYTQGNDVHFAPGQFKPDTSAGQELLGHELTHVVQQRQGIVKPTTSAGGMPVNDDPGLENAADVMGKKAAQMKMPEKLNDK